SDTMLPSSLHKQIARLLRENAIARPTEPAPAEPPSVAVQPQRSAARRVIPVPPVEKGTPLEQAFRGQVQETAHGTVYVIERNLGEFLDEPAALVSAYHRIFHLHGDWLRTRDARGELYRLFENAPTSLLFFDLETTGLSSATPIFLVGTLRCTGDDFLITQFFARDYAEEKTMLHAFAELARHHAAFVTFNGKTFDLPYVRERMVYHHLKADLSHHHVDLLIHARRWWRSRLPNCKLQTLEYHLCHRARVDDIPSAQIPAAYHDFVRTRDAALLAPVIHHNALDVITMLELLCLLTAQVGGVE
ncbi:MAG: ribonuclease H-like domain-containing protein, partial [Abditibacteriales bacterium]|nr:ribonuclease H-like domain-containing protein [Abditibacteriales bacterium]MDW8368554.1 ribonuclease H-like domain-containing protein [Abditibacteriales bacterium]